MIQIEAQKRHEEEMKAPGAFASLFGYVKDEVPRIWRGDKPVAPSLDTDSAGRERQRQ